MIGWRHRWRSLTGGPCHLSGSKPATKSATSHTHAPHAGVATHATHAADAKVGGAKHHHHHAAAPMVGVCKLSALAVSSSVSAAASVTQHLHGPHGLHTPLLHPMGVSSTVTGMAVSAALSSSATAAAPKPMDCSTTCKSPEAACAAATDDAVSQITAAHKTLALNAPANAALFRCSASLAAGYSTPTGAHPLAGPNTCDKRAALTMLYVPYQAPGTARAVLARSSTSLNAPPPGISPVAATLALGGLRSYSSFYQSSAAPSSSSSSSASGSGSSNSLAAATMAAAAVATASGSTAGATTSGSPFAASSSSSSSSSSSARRPTKLAIAAPTLALAVAGLATTSAAAAKRHATTEPEEVSNSPPPSPPPTPSSPSASSTTSGSDSASSGSSSPRQPPRHLSPTNAGAAMIPHPEKAAKGGEDAVFVSSTGRMPMVLAVADGVGGWGEHGVDAGLFSRALLAGVEHKLLTQFAAAAKQSAAAAVAAMDTDAPSSVAVDAATLLALPLDLMQFGYDHVRNTKILGSCTACIVAVHNNQLTARNLGDSGFMVLRRVDTPDADGRATFPLVPMQVVLRSREQQHQFNFPMQLGCAQGSAEQPSDADAYTAAVRPGDLIVVGTDGLFDNLHDQTIAALVYRALMQAPTASAAGAATASATSPDTKEIAKVLALEAHRVAGSKEPTPFADGARRHGQWFVGGKMDDISVVVGVV